LKHYVVTGATLAFRASFKPLVLPIPASWMHDAWIASIIGAVTGCSAIDVPLIRYRQHPDQQLGEKRSSLFVQFQVARTMTQSIYRTVAETYELVSERLQSAKEFQIPSSLLQALSEKVSHFRARTRMRDAGVWRLPLILREVSHGRYRRFSLGWKS